VLAALVILLVRQNHTLRARLSDRAHESGAMRSAARPPALDVGDHLEPLQVFGAGPIAGADAGDSPGEGDVLRFSAAPAATLLFFFAGGCSYCDQMAPAVMRVSREGDRLGVPVVGVQADASTPADLKHTGLGFSVCAPAHGRGSWVERIATVPGLALVDRSGAVRRVWWGQIDGAQELEVYRAMEGLAAEGQQASSSAPR
jgi:hypothetical protein